jgi:diacylglycerol kinase (ATP)
MERAVLTGSLLIVPIVELLNSAIEANVDRVGLERHELSGRAKDIASAAVFLSVVFAALVWGLVLVPKWI